MSDQRTEQPTHRRLQQAREKGQFPHAKELVGALQFLVVVLIVTRSAQVWFASAQIGFREALLPAFRRDWAPADLIRYGQGLVISAYLPLGVAASLLVLLTLAFQIGLTNFGVHLGALSPNFSRLNPLSKIQQIPKQNIPQAIQALLLMAVLFWVIYGIGSDHLPALLSLTLSPVSTGVNVFANTMSSVLWKTTFLLVLFGTVEGFRQRMVYQNNLRMSKQEIREEMKESDGDPHIKARIKRLRRDLLRRRMMQDVPTATAIIVNPTHYAVAIRYDPGTMASPKVVAKGRNYLAARIREIARENGVLIVENPPLARALYGSVDVGQDISPDFYRAVAEVLAYVYRMSGHRTIPG